MTLQEKLSTARAYRKVFSTPEGKLVLKDLSSRCGITSQRYGRTDTERSQNEAFRNIFFYVLNKSSLDNSLLEEWLFAQQDQQTRELPKNEDQTNSTAGSQATEPSGYSLNQIADKLLSV